MKAYIGSETNFGDCLKRIVLEWLEPNIEFVDKEYHGKIISIGSILNRNPPVEKEHDIIWGAGSIINKPFTTKARVVAVRGPLTAGLLNMDVPFGDPAILLPLILQYNETKKYKKLYIRHLRDEHLELTTKDGEIVVNRSDDPHEIIQKINQSELVVSSALHPLIVAEAYGIPAVWVKMSNKDYFYKKGRFKFNDYFESTGRKAKPKSWDSEEVNELPNLRNLQDELLEAWKGI